MIGSEISEKTRKIVEEEFKQSLNDLHDKKKESYENAKKKVAHVISEGYLSESYLLLFMKITGE